MVAPLIGPMRERLVLLQRVETKDSHGSPVAAYSTLDSVPAEQIPLRAGERLQAQAIESLVETRFRIRMRGDVVATMRAQWRPSYLTLSTPKTLEIHGVYPDPLSPSVFLLLEVGEVA